MFWVVQHPMDAETHNIPPGELVWRSFSVGIKWLGGRSLHTTRSLLLDIFGGCVQCLVSSV